MTTEATFHVHTDETGFTFVRLADEETPHWVMDHLEAAHVHTDELPTPEPGAVEGPFVATYDPGTREIMGVSV